LSLIANILWVDQHFFGNLLAPVKKIGTQKPELAKEDDPIWSYGTY
jgi:hypothetical protein